MQLDKIYTVSKTTGPLLHLQITPIILIQYQPVLVQRIVRQSALNSTCYFVKKYYEQSTGCGTVYIFHFIYFIYLTAKQHTVSYTCTVSQGCGSSQCTYVMLIINWFEVEQFRFYTRTFRAGHCQSVYQCFVEGYSPTRPGWARQTRLYGAAIGM